MGCNKGGSSASCRFLRLPGRLPAPRTSRCSPGGYRPPGLPRKAPPARGAGSAFRRVQGGGSPPWGAAG
eukprot:6267522-Alexandrium_andersonii.AAC.1